MKFILFALISTMALSTSSAFANSRPVLLCHLSGGGKILVLATESKNKVNLKMDDTAQMQLGVASAVGLSATFESNDPGSVNGPIDLLEIGKGFDTDNGVCGMGLQFNVDNQALGRNRDVALRPSFSYNKIACNGAEAKAVESCSLAAGVSSVNSLKKLISIEVAD